MRYGIDKESSCPLSSDVTSSLRAQGILIIDVQANNWVPRCRQMGLLVDYKHPSPVVEKFYKKATGSSPIRLRTHWFGSVFRGEMPDLPLRVGSPQEMIAHVATTPNAIGRGGVTSRTVAAEYQDPGSRFESSGQQRLPALPAGAPDDLISGSNGKCSVRKLQPNATLVLRHSIFSEHLTRLQRQLR